jgi:hypothetical protein
MGRLAFILSALALFSLSPAAGAAAGVYPPPA